MPPIAHLALQLRDTYEITTLVETGSYQGESTSWAAEHFEKVITVDIMPGFIEQCKERCKEFDNVAYLLGDTRHVLPRIVDKLKKPALFWLDAHNANSLFAREGDDCPILEELADVLAAHKGHCILIDDANCFTPPLPHDPKVWPEISAIEAVAERHGYLFRRAYDVLAMVPPSAIDCLTGFGDGTVDENLCEAYVNPRTGRRPFHVNLMPPKLTLRATAMLTPLEENVVVHLPAQITEQVDTAYGRMLVPKYDTNQTQYLRDGYSMDHVTIEKLIEDMKKLQDPVFIDIGANVGCFSFALVPYCSKVFAFEAQRIIYNMFCGSVAINGWQNIFCYNMAISGRIEQIEVPQFDYTRTCSFGSIEFGPKQLEKLHQERARDENNIDYVQAVPLDFFKYPRVDLIKVDIEGMEFKFLRGAKETIAKHRPLILIEHGKVNGASLRRNFQEDLNYDVQDNGNDFYCTPKERM